MKQNVPSTLSETNYPARECIERSETLGVTTWRIVLQFHVRSALRAATDTT